MGRRTVSFAETLRTALQGIQTHRLRSGLTMLGILIGIAAVILTVGLGQGAQKQVRDSIDKLGKSVLQPEWAGADELYVISDRSGYWNLYLVAEAGGEPVAIRPVDADLGGPLWRLGARWYTPLDDGRLLTVRTLGTDTLGVLDPATGELTDIALDGHSSIRLGARAGTEVLLVTAGARCRAGCAGSTSGPGRWPTSGSRSTRCPTPGTCPRPG